MSKRELVAHELNTAAEEDLDALLDLIRAIKVRRAESPSPILAESSLAKDWLTEEEEAAWADL